MVFLFYDLNKNISIFTYFTFVKTVPSFLRYAGLQRLSQKLFTNGTTVKVICMGGEPCLNGKQNHYQSKRKVPLCGLYVNCVLCSRKLDNSQVDGSCCIRIRTIRRIFSRRADNIPSASVELSA